MKPMFSSLHKDKKKKTVLATTFKIIMTLSSFLLLLLLFDIPITNEHIDSNGFTKKFHVLPKGTIPLEDSSNHLHYSTLTRIQY